MTLESVIVFIIVGLIAGFLASLVVMGRGRGWFWNVIIGMLGAILGSLQMFCICRSTWAPIS